MGWWSWVWAAPPAGVDPDDIPRWETLADGAMRGPAGCWALEGTLRVDAQLLGDPTGSSRGGAEPMGGVGVWSGTLDDGVWTRFRYEYTEPASDTRIDAVTPLIGRVAPQAVEHPKTASQGGIRVQSDGNTQGVDSMKQLIDAWNPSTSTSVASWSDALQAVVLVQDHPISPRPRSPVTVVTSVFPGGGDAVTRIDAVFPKRIREGAWPAVLTLDDMQFHLRQQVIGDVALPAVESLSVTAAVLGFTLRYHQQITTSLATPCASP